MPAPVTRSEWATWDWCAKKPPDDRPDTVTVPRSSLKPSGRRAAVERGAGWGRRSWSAEAGGGPGRGARGGGVGGGGGVRGGSGRRGAERAAGGRGRGGGGDGAAADPHCVPPVEP